MRKLSYIVIFFLLLLQACGLLIFYEIKQYYVKYEMWKYMENEKNEFEKLTITATLFNKSKINSREIFYEGKMYDIKSVKISGDRVELLVIDDVREKSIIEKIRILSGIPNSPNEKVPSQIIKFISLVYLSIDDNQSFLSPCHNRFFSSNSEKIYSVHITILSPPPELA